jgi:hypothetical protein
MMTRTPWLVSTISHPVRDLKSFRHNHTRFSSIVQRRHFESFLLNCSLEGRTKLVNNFSKRFQKSTFDTSTVITSRCDSFAVHITPWTIIRKSRRYCCKNTAFFKMLYLCYITMVLITFSKKKSNLPNLSIVLSLLHFDFVQVIQIQASTSASNHFLLTSYRYWYWY